MALRPRQKRSLRVVPKSLVRTRKARKRFRGTFLHVDDADMPHNTTNVVAHDLRLKKVFAYDPMGAKHQLEMRVEVIKKLWRIKRLQRERTKDPKRKAFLQKQMDYLAGAEKAPFDIVISDINMYETSDKGSVYGAHGVRLVNHIRSRYPNQKILLYSDDYDNLAYLTKKHGVPYVNKESSNDPIEEIKEVLMRKLNLKPILRPKGKAKFTPTRIKGP